MRLKAKGAGLKRVEDYRTDQPIDDVRLLAKGFQKLEGSFWDQVGGMVPSGRDVYWIADGALTDALINQYLTTP